MRRCLEPRLPPACMIGLDFHAPRVAALPFETQNAITGRIDSKPHGRPIRTIRDRQAISYRLMTALHRVPIPADECYRQRSRFIYVTLPIWIIGQDCHVANFKPISSLTAVVKFRTVQLKGKPLTCLPRKHAPRCNIGRRIRHSEEDDGLVAWLTLESATMFFH
jgi:hypothetical protein